MSERTWTDEQKHAIYARGGSVLVSAAAGSGKTAVLVERVIQMVCDTAKPHPIDRFLIVTFTKAAAAEMRERIGKALSQKLEQDPTNAYLRRQQMLLPAAEICTIDSFCSTVVKRYFHELGIAPDFRMLDDSERAALEDEVVTNCINTLCEKKSAAFYALSNLFSLGSSDATLKDAILTLFRNAQVYPSPERWLREIPADYSPALSIQESIWYPLILQNIRERIEEGKRAAQQALDLMCDDAPLAEAYAPAIEKDLQILSALEALASSNRWDALLEYAQDYKNKKEDFKPAPKAYKDSAIQANVKALRERAKKSIESIPGLMPCSEQEFQEDMAFLQPVVQLLVDTVCAFSEALFAEKLAQNAYEFNDISHMTLNLVVTQNPDGTYHKTPVADALREKYDYIFLDEYQDTNEMQDLLFSAISRDEQNLFMVGDIKQSIYGFRLAMPELFLKRRASYADFDGKTFPARITLDRNFRSRKTVAKGINFMFDRLMTPEIGGVDYRATERLNPEADFIEQEDPPLELHLLSSNSPTETGELPEAEYVAGLIERLITSGMLVRGKDGEKRPVRYGDICILMRALGNAPKYRDALENAGIPAFYQKKGGFFSMQEIRVIFSLLKTINNPLQDVPLAACLMSPIWGFTPDELAEIKLSSQEETLFQKMQTSKSEKCKNFLAEYNALRALSVTLSPAALLRTIYERTGFMAVAGAMNGGDNRKLNLLLLLEYAQTYTDNGKTGLSGFLRYLEKLEANEAKLEAATGVSEYADVVRIMTIHKSKGLEFPVVILANGGKQFNKNDQYQKLLIHPAFKLGLRIYDSARRRIYTSLPYVATQLAKDIDAKAEELRVLYVALTRAKEKLILVGSGSYKHRLPKIVDRAATVAGDKTLPAAFVRGVNSYLDWIIAALVQHPEAETLRALSEFPFIPKTTADFHLQVFCDEPLTAKTKETETAEPASPTDEWLSYIASRVEYTYPGLPLSACPAKISASALNESDTGFTFFATAKPAFLGKGGMTPAMRGTVTHRFAEVCDFAAAKVDLEQEIERLKTRGFLSEEACEMLDREALQAFFQSSLFERMQNADALYREQKFTVFFPAGEVQSDLPKDFSSERVLVQGVIDCIFLENGKLVLVDYKTDRTKDEDALKERYKKQLAVYKRAAEEMFGLPVEAAILYAFSMKKEVRVNI